jgi:cell division transport system permease protein
MRLNYILSDLGIGLRRNLSMTIAVVVTIWVSLSLFGSALLAREQVDLMKGNWYDKIQISVFLWTPVAAAVAAPRRPRSRRTGSSR